MKRTIAFALAFAVASAAHAFSPKGAPDAEVRVPLRVLPGNNMMLVAATVNGTPCSLLFDTGATHTSLDSAFAAKALAGVSPKEVVISGDTNVKDRPVSLEVESLTVGDAKFTGFSVMSVNLSHLTPSIGAQVDGVLGMNVISCVPVLVSAGGGEVVFNPGEPRKQGFGNALKSVSPDPLEIMFGLRLRGRPVPILVDSGASMSFMNSKNWPKGTNDVSMASTDANGRSGMSASLGAKAVLPLGTSVEFQPFVSDSAPDCIGADVLKRYDMLLEAGTVRFRSFNAP